MKGTGYIPSKKDLRNYRINKACRTQELPKEYKVEHARIKDQKSVSSCVAFSTSSVLEEALGKKYSTAWIYGYRPNDYYQGEGMSTLDALRTIHKIGFVEERELKGNYEMDKAKEVVDYYLSTNPTINNKVMGYACLHNIQEIKQAIYTTGLPIVLSIATNGMWIDENNIIIIPDEATGGHQMVCYGWNETGLLLQNSWGESFGDKGCCILPYEYPVSEAWVIKFDKPEEIMEKPKLYWLRNLIMKIVKIIRRLRK